MKKIALLLTISLCVLMASYVAYLYQHQQFTPNQLVHTFCVKEPLDLPELTEAEIKEVRRILDQPFSYLDLGQQMTAYESADHQYVLKMFNPRPPLSPKIFYTAKKLAHLFSLKWIVPAFFSQQRLIKLFERYALAFRELKEETGLVCVHLQPSLQFHQQVVEVVDRDGILYRCNLSVTPFVLQKKAELAKTRLDTLRQAGDTVGLQTALTQLRELFVSRAKKGVTDRIQTLHNNYGFIGDKAIQIDVGRVWVDPVISANPLPEVDRIMTRITENL